MKSLANARHIAHLFDVRTPILNEKDTKMTTKTIVLLFPAMLAGITSATGMSDPPPRAAADTAGPIQQHRVLATLWMKHAAEVRALQYQAFNLARMRLDQELAKPRTGKKPAVIVDVDETVLDTSAFQAALAAGNQEFPAGWRKWISSAQATAVPGSLAFLQHAADSGVAVFYVTNRREPMKDGTLRNLAALGFPSAKEAHILCKTKTSDKAPRREAVARSHRILLLIGDNLNDFDAAFLGKNTAERAAAVDRRREAFGSRFIILPNAMYGHWESAFYGYDWSLTPAQRSVIRLRLLRGSATGE